MLAPERINAVDGTPRGFLVAVGNHGTIVHMRPGQHAQIVHSPTQRDLLDVLVASDKFAVAVGAGIMLCWDGVSWRTVSLESSSMRYSQVWTAPDLSLVLYAGSAANTYRICPWVPGRDTQPFCRHFAAPLRAACGLRDQVQIVIANGEIYRVNDALIGPEGNFEPVYRPAQPMSLKAAWMPDAYCPSKGGITEVFAIGMRGGLLHFDGVGWRPLKKLPAQSSLEQSGSLLTDGAYANSGHTLKKIASIASAELARASK